MAELVDARDLKSPAATDNASVFGKTSASAPVETAANPARLENISDTVFNREEDGQFQIGHGDGAPCFPTRQFALRVARGHPPEPAPVAKFRRIKIREVRSNAPA